MFASPVRLAEFPSPQAPKRSLLVAAWLACIAMTGSAQADSVLDAIGGPGGGDFTARCPGDEALIGVRVRRGDDLDAIGLLCANPTGARDAGAAARGGLYGGSGGQPDNIACAAKDPVVHGLWITFEGGDREFVNNVALSCGSPYGRTSTPGNNGIQYCPVGQVAVGLHGRSGAMVDAVGLLCAAAATPPAPPRTPVMPGDRREAVSTPMRRTFVGNAATAVTRQPPIARTAGEPPPGTIPGQRVEGNQQDYQPPQTPPDRGSTTAMNRHGDLSAMLQPDHSIRIDVRYRADYGYKTDAGSGPDSCAAFFVSVGAASNARPDRPTDIVTQGPMRRSRDDFVCTYIASDLPLDAPLMVRVVMSDQRAAGSATWQGGNQSTPPPGQRRTIVDPGRSVVLTTTQPKAALVFRMVYSGSP